MSRVSNNFEIDLVVTLESRNDKTGIRVELDHIVAPEFE